MSYHDLTGETRGRPASAPGQPRPVPAPADGPPRAGASWRGKLLGALVAISAIAGFAGIAWYATNQGQKNSSTVVPVIQADESPVKVLPEKPGGMKVPNQDKLIYLQISPDAKKPKDEKVLPGAEKPMAKPKPPAAEDKTAASKTPQSAEVTQPPIEPPKVAAPEEAADKAKAEAGAKTKAVAKDAAKTVEAPAPAAKDTGLDRDALQAKVAAAAKGEEGAGAKPDTKPEQTAKASPEKPDAGAVAAPGGFRVQLGSSKLKDRAEAEAKRLNKLHDSVLGEAQIAAVRADLGKRGVFYRLWAGPFAEYDAAQALCAKLKARKQGCLVVKR